MASGRGAGWLLIAASVFFLVISLVAFASPGLVHMYDDMNQGHSFDTTTLRQGSPYEVSMFGGGPAAGERVTCTLSPGYGRQGVPVTLTPAPANDSDVVGTFVSPVSGEYGWECGAEAFGTLIRPVPGNSEYFWAGTGGLFLLAGVTFLVRSGRRRRKVAAPPQP
ncbi:hypothetical protein ABGB18_19790 [Nonomuraea sp. B12E4]|uniref:hypothetical protein n=1 Tax=Nonomuraea sp. B12E4 TaxID=3153564 RepID=UPI00325C71F2